MTCVFDSYRRVRRHDRRRGAGDAVGSDPTSSMMFQRGPRGLAADAMRPAGDGPRLARRRRPVGIRTSCWPTRAGSASESPRIAAARAAACSSWRSPPSSSAAAGCARRRWLATVLALPALADAPIVAASALGGRVRGPRWSAPTMRPTRRAAVAMRRRALHGHGRLRARAATGRATWWFRSRPGRQLADSWMADARGRSSTRARTLLDRSRSVADVRSTASPRRGLDARRRRGPRRRRPARGGAGRRGLARRGDPDAASSRWSTASSATSSACRSARSRPSSTPPPRCWSTIEAARSIVYYRRRLGRQHASADADAARRRAKAQVTAAGARAAESALTLHGAIGYTWEHDLQLFYKRAKLDVALFGAPARVERTHRRRWPRTGRLTGHLVRSTCAIGQSFDTIAPT